MSQCVPSWNIEDTFNNNNQFQHLLQSSTSVDPQLSVSSFEVAELTWENGHLSAHGLVKPTAIYTPDVAGTLECIVDQAKLLHNQLPAATDGLVPGLPTHQRHEDLASGIGSCNNIEQRNKRTWKERLEDHNTMTTTVGSRDNTITCNIDDFGFTPTNSIGGSPDTKNTSLNRGGGSRQITMADDHDSICRSIRSQSQREMSWEEDGKVTEGGAVRSNVSTKRARTAAIHNQSERKRRDKINQKMRTLQKLVPSSSKTDKASILDEVIDYLKQLQAQVAMMSKMSGMLMPLGMQQFQMAMIAQMAQMTQMSQMSSMGTMDISTIRGVGQPMGISPILPMSSFMPMIGGWDPSVDCMQQPAGGVPPNPFSAFAACPLQQPMTMDAHQRLAALYQQMFQQNQPTNPKDI